MAYALTPADIALLRQAQALIERLLAPEPEPAVPPSAMHGPIAWGAKVSPTFKERVFWICDQLFTYPDAPSDLMSCMAWETGRKFKADTRNAAGSSATGLLQFMKATAEAMGTTTAALAAMTAEDQLRYVFHYLRPYAGRIRNLSDMYMAVLWPKAVGQPEEYVLFEKGTLAYKQNQGLDSNKDGSITKAETAARLYAIKAEGLRLGNIG